MENKKIEQNITKNRDEVLKERFSSNILLDLFRVDSLNKNEKNK